MRSLFVGMFVETDAESAVDASLVLPPLGLGYGLNGRAGQGASQLLLLDGAGRARDGSELHLQEQAGNPVWIPMLMLFGEKEEEIEALAERARDLDSEQLLSDTMRLLRRRAGVLRVENEIHPLSSFVRRGIHAQLIAPLVDGIGDPVGS